MGWAVIGLSSCWILVNSVSVLATNDVTARCMNLETSDMPWARKNGYREWCRLFGYYIEPSSTHQPSSAEVELLVHTQDRSFVKLRWVAGCVTSVTSWSWCGLDQMNANAGDDEPWSPTEVACCWLTVAVTWTVMLCGLDLMRRTLLCYFIKLDTYRRRVHGKVLAPNPGTAQVTEV